MTYQPTQADLDARERARQAGRALAEAGQATTHTPTAEDQPPADEGSLTVRMPDLLKLEPEAPAPAPAAEAVRVADPAPAPTPAPHAMKPLPGGLPTSVWLAKLAQFHGAVRCGPRSSEGEPGENHRVTWAANDAEQSADFATATSARLFVVDAADADVHVDLQAKATAVPESGAPVADDAPAGPTGPETTGDGSTGRESGFVWFGCQIDTSAMGALVKRMGAYQGGDAFRAPKRTPDHFRVTWRGSEAVTLFADFESEAVADNLAQYLQTHGEPGTRGISLEGPLDQDDDAAFYFGGVTLNLADLFREALLAELKSTRARLNVVRWWAIAGWLTALCFGAAAIAMAVALRGVL